MFDIEYKGANTVVISTKKSSLVTDPKLSLVGLNDIVVKNGIELATESRFKTDNPDFKLSIECPGSFEVSDFSINGFPEKRHIDAENDRKNSTIYSIEVSGVKIGLIGNVGPTISDEQFENLGILDIIILPIGGNGYTLDATSASKIARSADTKVIIPVHYADDGLKYEMPQDEFDVFAKEMGCPVEETNKYKIKTPASLPETLTIVKINRTK